MVRSGARKCDASRTIEAAAHPSRRSLLRMRWSLLRAMSAHREVEISVAERLALQGEVPPFHVIGTEAALAHGGGQQHAMTMRLRAHARVERIRARAEEIERRAHIELA